LFFALLSIEAKISIVIQNFSLAIKIDRFYAKPDTGIAVLIHIAKILINKIFKQKVIAKQIHFTILVSLSFIDAN
jgi:hypothetical protein